MSAEMYCQVIPATPQVDTFQPNIQSDMVNLTPFKVPSRPVSPSSSSSSSASLIITRSRSSSRSSTSPICCGWHMQQHLDAASTPTSRAASLDGGPLGLGETTSGKPFDDARRKGARLQREIEFPNQQAPITWAECREAWAKIRPRWKDGQSIWEDFEHVHPGGLMPTPRFRSRETKTTKVIPIPTPQTKARIVCSASGKAILLKPGLSLVGGESLERLEMGNDGKMWRLKSKPSAALQYAEEPHDPESPNTNRQSSDLDDSMDFESQFAVASLSSQWPPITIDDLLSDPESESSDVESFITGYYIPEGENT